MQLRIRTMAWLYKQKGKSENWWIGYRLNGKQHLRTTGTSDRAKAEQELARLESMNQAHKAGSLTEEFFRLLTNRTASAKTLSGTVTLWLTECKDYSTATIDSYRDRLEEFCKHIGANDELPIRDVRPDHIRDYLRAKRATTSTATAKQHRKVLCAFFNYAVDNEILTASPVPSSKSLKLTVRKGQRDKDKRRAFTLAELKTVYEKAPNDFWRYMVLGGFYTALRMGDLITMPWGAVDLDGGVINLTTRKTGTSMHIPVHPKFRVMLANLKRKAGQNCQKHHTPATGVVRSLPEKCNKNITNDAQARELAKVEPEKRLEGKVKPADYIWPDEAARYEEFGAGLFSNEFYDDVLLPAGLVVKRSKHAAKDANGNKILKQGRKVNPITFHCLRHTFVSLVKITGGSQAVAKELAGHSSDAVSDLYTHVPENVLSRAIAKLPEVTK